MFNYTHGDVGSKTAKFETHIPAQELHFLETINHNFVASIFLGKKVGFKWRDELENLYTALASEFGQQ